MNSKVAMIGLGAMGSRMARRLVDAGHSLRVYNRTRSRSEALAQLGAQVADSPREAVRGCDFVISMVRDDHASRDVWLHPTTGALAALGADSIAVESSTLSPRWVAELDAKMRGAARAFVDAPVAGSRPQAEAGQLIYLVGGEANVVERIAPLLRAMGSEVHHIGRAGTGCIMKLSVNALFGVQVAALGELLGMLEKAGVEASQAMSVLGAMPITSPAAKGVGGAMAARQFAPMFPIDLVEKDLGYVAEALDRWGADCPTSAAARHVFRRAKEAGMADENLTAVIKLFDGAA